MPEKNVNNSGLGNIEDFADAKLDSYLVESAKLYLLYVKAYRLLYGEPIDKASVMVELFYFAAHHPDLLQAFNDYTTFIYSLINSPTEGSFTAAPNMIPLERNPFDPSHCSYEL